MQSDMAQSFRVAVGIPTAGRPRVVEALLEHLEGQTRPADLIVVAAPEAVDVDGLDPKSASLVIAPRGLTKQRNAILDAAADCDIVVFFDDDFVAHASYLLFAERLFERYPEIVMATGCVLADGIIGPGIGFDEARRYVEADRQTGDEQWAIRDVYNGYGCNMAVRMEAVRRGGIRFDERLPAYGWLEDVDFSRRLACEGRIVASKDMRGVHMGTKSGRQPGMRLGYSQIANPIYLARKGSFAWPRAWHQMGRNVAMNLARSLRPEPYVDRRGRLRGNAAALRDLALGRMHPERISSL